MMVGVLSTCGRLLELGVIGVLLTGGSRAGRSTVDAVLPPILTQLNARTHVVLQTGGNGATVPLFTRDSDTVAAAGPTELYQHQWDPLADSDKAVIRHGQQFLRLPLNLHALATGTQTTQAGAQPLDSLHWGRGRMTSLTGESQEYNNGDSLQGAYVYVPPQCVGMRRAPLVILLHGAGMTGVSMLNWGDGIVRHLADSLGVIILAPSAMEGQGGMWTNPGTPQDSDDVRRLGVAIRYVLRHYAIDPARIALAGVSNGGLMALMLGLANGDVFPWLVGFSPALDAPSLYGLTVGPRRGTPRVFIAYGKLAAGEDGGDYDNRPLVRLLKRSGYAVTSVRDTAAHPMTQERASAGFHWLMHVWRAPRAP